MRVFGIILVLLAHSTHLYTTGWAYSSPYHSNFFNLLTWYIYSFHMPLFVFISGAVFNYTTSNGEYENFHALIKKKALRLMVPYLFVGLLYMIPIRMVIAYYKGVSYKSLVIDFLTTIGSGHLWYLYVLFILTIIFWFLKPIIKEKNYRIILLMAIVLYFISPRLPIIFLVGATAHFFIYFYLGYLFQENEEKVLKCFQRVSYLMIIYVFIVQLIFFFLMRILAEYQINLAITACLMLFEIFLAIIGIVLMYLIVNKIMSLSKNIFSFWPLTAIKKYNMSIYLLHEPIIFAILSYLASINLYSVLIVNICFWSTLGLSIFLSKLISKNFLVSFLFGSLT